MAVPAILCYLTSLAVPQGAEAMVELGGDRIEVRPHGGLGARDLDGIRAPILALAAVRTWRARVRIATTLEVGRTRMTLDPSAVAGIRLAVAGFASTVRRWTRGRVRIDADVATLAEPLRVAERDDGPWFPTPTKAENFGVSGRDVDSVFLVFPPGKREWPMLGGTFGGDRGPDGAGSSAIAWVSSRRGEMVRVFLHEWLHQIEWIARRSGGMPWLPGSHDAEDLGFVDEDRALAAIVGGYLSPAFWRDADPRVVGKPVPRLPVGERYPWAQVAADPWRRLPLLDEAGLSALAGYPIQLRVAAGSVAATFPGAAPVRGLRPDRFLSLREESVLLLACRSPRRYLVLVRGDRAALFASALRRPSSSAGEAGEITAGVVLPLRPRRRVDAWSAGGTATPLAVFVTTFPRRPETEVEMLTLAGAGLQRSSGAAVVGCPVEFSVPGATDVRLRIDGRLADPRDPVRIVPDRPGPLSLQLQRGGDRIDYRIPVLPQVEVELRPRSGPPVLVRSGAAFLCEVANHGPVPRTLAFVAETRGTVRVEGLAGQIDLAPGQRRALPCTLHCDPIEDPADLRMRVRVFAAAKAARRQLLGIGDLRLRRAVGGDFLRLDFDRRTEADPTPAEDRGEWRGRVVTLPRGGGCLRVDDGGGSRFGRVALMRRSTAAFDTKQFPFLSFRLRARPRPGVRAALNLRVGSQVVSIPLVGDFVRAWDRRRPLRRPELRLDGRWETVVYDLDLALEQVLGPGNHRVAAIDLGDTRALCSNRFTGTDGWQFELDEFAVVRRPTPGPALHKGGR